MKVCGSCHHQEADHTADDVSPCSFGWCPCRVSRRDVEQTGAASQATPKPEAPRWTAWRRTPHRPCTMAEAESMGVSR